MTGATDTVITKNVSSTFQDNFRKKNEQRNACIGIGPWGCIGWRDQLAGESVIVYLYYFGLFHKCLHRIRPMELYTLLGNRSHALFYCSRGFQSTSFHYPAFNNRLESEQGRKRMEMGGPRAGQWKNFLKPHP